MNQLDNQTKQLILLTLQDSADIIGAIPISILDAEMKQQLQIALDNIRHSQHTIKSIKTNDKIN